MKDDMKGKIKGKSSRIPQLELMGINENVDVQENENVNVDVNIHVNKDVNIDIDNSFLNQLVNVEPPKKRLDSLVNSGIYFEEDVYKILMTLAKKGGRGAKSRIVNDALKVAFKQAGLME